MKKLTASDAEASDAFGYSVAISGDTAVVGAPFEDAGGSNAGAAYVFQRDQGGADNWGEVKKLTASDAQAGDAFGWSVAASGPGGQADTAVVGAFLEDAGGSNAGAAYVFQRDEGGTDNWGEVTKLTASGAEPYAQFGWSVAVSGDTAVVGAPGEDDGGSQAGAAYVFDLLQPKPVAGIAELPEVAGLPLEADGSSGPNAGLLAGVAAAVSAGAVTLGGAAWWARRRWR